MRLLLLIFLAAQPAASDASPSPVRGTRATPPPAGAAPHDLTHPGCCSDKDVTNFGYHVDFGAWPDGEEMTDQLRSIGLLIGRGVDPAVPVTQVATDPSRAYACERVLSGEPSFTGSEFMIFVSPTQNRWARVQNVGVNVGYSDRTRISFLAAYDSDGNLLEAKYNDRVGFQFLSIQRPTPDISRILVGDCDGPFCYPDGGGSAFNCLTFSGPVVTTLPLPATISMPPSPAIQGVPAATPGSALALMGGLAALAAAVLSAGRRKRPS